MLLCLSASLPLCLSASLPLCLSASLPRQFHCPALGNKRATARWPRVESDPDSGTLDCGNLWLGSVYGALLARQAPVRYASADAAMP
ncbi:TPA: hypothetical protein F3L11_09800 [Aeromonas hydrophila]|nr:hypothetical protein [Aeromonas hydrophila]